MSSTKKSDVAAEFRLNAMKKKFGDLPLPILTSINDDGLVYFYYLNGEKIYGFPPAGLNVPLNSEVHTGLGETQQQFRDECDINLVLKKYGVHESYVPEEVAIAADYFRDVSQVPMSITDAFDAVDEAKEMFLMLPAEARRAVGDDPVQLFRMAQTEEGLAKLSEFGFGVSPQQPPKTSNKAPGARSAPEAPAQQGKKPKASESNSGASNVSSDQDDQ